MASCRLLTVFLVSSWTPSSMISSRYSSMSESESSERLSLISMSMLFSLALSRSGCVVL